MAITSRRSSPLALVQAAQVGEQARARACRRGACVSSWLMKASSSSPVMPCGLAAQSRQR